MAGVFKLDGVDFWTQLRLNQGEGLNPADPNVLQPQFASAGISEGAPLISVTQGNRELAWPVVLTPGRLGYADTKDGLHQLVTDLHERLRSLALVEWQDEGASSSTFLNVVSARFEPDYDYRRGVHSRLWGTIRVWTLPYGHAGTNRILATAAATGPVVVLTVPSAIQGDAPGLPVVKVTAGKANVDSGRIAGFSVLPHPSYVVSVPIASLTDLSALTTVTGASGAVGSQFLTVAHDILGYAAFSIPLAIPSIYAGQRHRVLLIAKSMAEGGYSLNLVDPAGHVGATAVATAFRDWQLLDMGAVAIPSTVPTVTRLPVIVARNTQQAGYQRSVDGSAYLGLDEVLMFPEDTTSLIVDTNNGTVLGYDDFETSGDLTGLNDRAGNPWLTSDTVFTPTPPQWLTSVGGQIGAVKITGSAAASMVANTVLGHPQAADLHGFVRFRGLRSPNGTLNTIEIGKVGSSVSNGNIYGELGWASGAYLSVRAQGFSVGAPTTLASVGLAPSGLVATTYYELDFLANAPAFTVGLRSAVSSQPITNTLGTGFERLTVTASAFDTLLPGMTIIGMSQPSLSSSNHAWEITAVHAEQVAAPSLAQPFDTVFLDGVADTSYRQASGGDLTGWLTPAQRGEMPKLTPSAPRVAVIEAPRQPAMMADSTSVEVRVRERFTYFR